MDLQGSSIKEEKFSLIIRNLDQAVEKYNQWSKYKIIGRNIE